MIEFTSSDYEDTFSVQCPPGRSMVDILFAFFSFEPFFVKALMGIRNAAMSVVGLKTERASHRLDRSMLKSGSRIGFFEIGEITSSSVVMGANDAHLNFRVIMKLQGQNLSCRTQVKFNNIFGRIYFFFVKPFHKLVVPAMLRSSIHQIESQANAKK